jgi:hypothetical protein
MKKLLIGALLSLFSAVTLAATTVPSSLINWVTPPSAPIQTAKFVFAAPNASAGVPTFRQLVASDIPTLAPLTGNLSQFAATTSAQLLGVISDETGSGALVFNVSPALTTPVISGGTVNNAAIGGTTPAAGTFTTLATTASSKVFASNTSGQSIPNNAITVVTGWTASTNQGSNFVASTGVFTAPRTGFYQVSAGLGFVSAAFTAGQNVAVIIMKNGSAIAQGPRNVEVNITTPQNAPPTSATIRCVAGDTISIAAFQNSGAAVALNNGGTVVYMSISETP